MNRFQKCTRVKLTVMLTSPPHLSIPPSRVRALYYRRPLPFSPLSSKTHHHSFHFPSSILTNNNSKTAKKNPKTKNLEASEWQMQKFAPEFDNESESDDYEFAFVVTDQDGAVAAADDIFVNGQIRPVYPLFDNRLLSYGGGGGDDSDNYSNRKSIGVQLRKLFMEEDGSSVSSSSEADELDGVAPGTYCVWDPKSAMSASAGRCKKSGSTGSLLKTKLRDLVRRSQSDVKDKFTFVPVVVGKGNDEGKAKISGNKFGSDGGGRKTFLPYKQDLIGFFASVNTTTGRSHHHS